MPKYDVPGGAGGPTGRTNCWARRLQTAYDGVASRSHRRWSPSVESDSLARRGRATNLCHIAGILQPTSPVRLPAAKCIPELKGCLPVQPVRRPGCTALDQTSRQIIGILVMTGPLRRIISKGRFTQGESLLFRNVKDSNISNSLTRPSQPQQPAAVHIAGWEVHIQVNEKDRPTVWIPSSPLLIHSRRQDTYQFQSLQLARQVKDESVDSFRLGYRPAAKTTRAFI